MKKFWESFFMRGVVAGWGGPIVLAIIYLCLGLSGVVQTLDVFQVVLGIVSSFVMAFVAAGISAVYQIEKLPLVWATLIQGGVLYIDYLGVYLLNGWLAEGIVPILIFTAIFIVGFVAIWLIVYFATKCATNKLNKRLHTQE